MLYGDKKYFICLLFKICVNSLNSNQISGCNKIYINYSNSINLSKEQKKIDVKIFSEININLGQIRHVRRIKIMIVLIKRTSKLICICIVSEINR